PYTFSFLEKTVKINKIKNIEIMNIDCKDAKIENWADHVFMGYHNVNKNHLRL
ncbi:hypothetical protein LCGC14_2533170, partial [marine sediment metagenome]